MAVERIPRLVLTGGPCAGKTTCLAMLMQKLPSYGVKPYLVPEIATLAITGGVEIGQIMANENLALLFERQMIDAQIRFEEIWEKFAAITRDERKVLICDRGTMDSLAYLEPRIAQALIHDMGLSVFDLRDKRYQAVFHLVTAAEGAEEYYNSRNHPRVARNESASEYNFDNPARYETPEQARLRDADILNAWNGHEHLKIVDNVEGERQISFDEKKEELLRAVCHALGIPAPLEIERKFLLDPKTDPKKFPVPVFPVAITQTYLKRDGEKERRIRARRETGDDLSSARVLYTYTEKRSIRQGVRHEVERILTAQEYLELLRDRDPNQAEIEKHRYAFPWKGQYFELDVITKPISLVVLEAELTDEQKNLVLPPFIKAVGDVTGDIRYSNAAIAAGLCPGY